MCNILLDQHFVSPSCQYLQKQVLSKFADHHTLIANELGKLSTKVSLTANIWTSVTNQTYLGVTIHYIDDQWKMQHYLLSLIHFEHHYTSIKTKKKLF